MAEEFETGICGGSWWNNLVVNPTRPTSFIGGGGGASICSADFGSWLAPTPSPDVVVSNNSSMNSDAFQNDSDSGGSAVTAAAGGVMIDSAALQMMGFGVGLSSPSPSSEDWNQRHHIASGNFNGSILEDEMNSCGRPLNNLIGLTNDFCIDPHQQSSLNINQAVTNSQSCATTSYGYNSLIQGLFESDSQQNPILSNGFASSPSSYGTGSSGLLLNGLSPSWSEFQNPNQNDNRPYSNGVSYWNNPSAATQTDSIRTGYLPAQNPFGGHGFDEKPSCPNNSTKPKNEVATNSKESKSGNKKGSSTEPNFKRPRLETPSSLPTFKVRKEKLGDRITALQQLVSPFGKTDTASVLHEAIEYIKFLHDQVSVLSTPYMKNGNPIQHPQGYDHKLDQKAQKEQDLRSRGLCLVPISSTFPVAHETTADFWTPTFGGSFR